MTKNIHYFFQALSFTRFQIDTTEFAYSEFLTNDNHNCCEWIDPNLSPHQQQNGQSHSPFGTKLDHSFLWFSGFVAKRYLLHINMSLFFSSEK